MITVADLLSRNAPAPVREVEPDTDGISVGALLRREGRAPHAADRPLQPRPHQQQAERDDDGRSDRRVLVRRGAIAAGTLLAAGSVLGATLLTDVVPTVNQAPAPGGAEDDGPYPGQGLLDPDGPVAAPPDSVVIDQAAARDPLDPGTSAPTDWVPVAFPGALAGGDAGTDDGATDGGDTGGSGSSGSSGDNSSSGAAADDDDDETTAKSSGDSGSSSSGSSDGGSSSGSSSGGDSGSSSDDSDSSDDDGDDDDRGLVGGLVDTVGGVLGLGGDDDRDSKKSESNNDGDEDDDKGSRSMRLSSADEDSSAPQDEDDSKSRDAESSDDDEDSDSGDDGGDSDDDGDRGLVGTVTDTVGGLLG